MKTITKRTKPIITNKSKQLTKQQLELVELVYKFRFVTSRLVCEKYGRRSKAVMHRRLQLLQEQGILGMRYDGHMRLRGEPASYYLLPEGIAALKAQSDPELVSRRTLQTAYKDRTAEKTFISDSLAIFQLYNYYRGLYGESMSFSTKSNMTFAAFDYFPDPIPNGFIRHVQSGAVQCYFLEYIRSHITPVGQYKLVKKYADYFADDKWSSRRSGSPIILLVCETESVFKAINKQVSANNLADDRCLVRLKDSPENTLA
jgi:hypothetical protein